MNTPELFSRLFTPARLWEKAENGLRCRLCARNCLIPEGAFGACGVRLNQDGSLYTAVGNRVAAVNLDPVEKKPLFHFLPGSTIFSVGTLGCNFHCSFCQNSSISQIEPDPAPGPGSGASPSAHPSVEAATGRAAGPDSASSASSPNALPNTFPDTFPGASPTGAAPRIPSMLGRGQAVSARELADAAERSGARSLAYTYNEPTVFFELLSDTAALALERGLCNVLVSNGFLSREAFAALRDLIQAANFDLKSFSPDFYRDLCGAALAPVLRTLKEAARSGWLVEVTTLVIGGVNDGQDELSDIASFIAGELGPDTPWHVSRFRPAYRMGSRPPTPLASLERALDCGQKKGLNYVYVGNLPGHNAENTFCPVCKALLIERRAYNTKTRWKKAGVCPSCGEGIYGIWG